jgi:hypothetical protein
MIALKASRVCAAAAAVVVAVASFPAQSNASQLSGSEIRQAIGGKKVLLQTRWGGFPLTYAKSGKVTGDGTALGLARFFAPKETGSWWLAGNRLCQQFPTWYKGQQFCFTLSRTNETTLRWVRDDGYSGTAKIQG